MKTVVPSYYKDFACIAEKCRHTCCIGWEIEVDEEILPRFRSMPDIARHVEWDNEPHIRLLPGERCPFLNERGLCDMIISHGEDVLCQICRDHPRFRNYWSDRVEIGLGLVCEEAGRLILESEKPMELVALSDDGENEELPKDEAWLLGVREELLSGISLKGPSARLLEYLLYRHIPDALYDGRLEERMRFVERSHREILGDWSEKDGLAALIERARQWSYDIEYDEEEKEKRINE